MNTSELHAAMPLCATLGIRSVSSDPVVLEMDWARTLCTTNGLLHGGAIMALADSAGALCAFLNLPEGANGTATTSSTTNFLGPVTEGVITATAVLLKVGSSVVVVETEVRDSRGRLVTKVTQSQAVLRPR